MGSEAGSWLSVPSPRSVTRLADSSDCTALIGSAVVNTEPFRCKSARDLGKKGAGRTLSRMMGTRYSVATGAEADDEAEAISAETGMVITRSVVRMVDWPLTVVVKLSEDERQPRHEHGRTHVSGTVTTWAPAEAGEEDTACAGGAAAAGGLERAGTLMVWEAVTV